MRITVTFDALDEFNAFMGKQFNLAEPAPAPVPAGNWYPGGSPADDSVPRVPDTVQPPEPPAEPVKPAEPEKPAEPVKPAEPEKPAEEKAAPENPAEPENPAVDHVAARKAMAALNKAAGENIARKLVSAFGYSRLTDMPAEKLPELMEVVARPLDDINAFIAEKGAGHAD